MTFIAHNHWWSNWPSTFGYVCSPMYFPRSLQEIKVAVNSVRIKDQSIKAVGGGWSFTDAALPFKNQSAVNGVSIENAGKTGTFDFSQVLLGVTGTLTPADFIPEELDKDLANDTHYHQATTTQVVNQNPQIDVSLIDIRGLASTLQDGLAAILSANAKPSAETKYFHVQAGITMTDLQQVLDHQNPRLAIQASGGNPLATLAGSLSTATHGGEFRWPLLVDRVKAIHFVGPAGVEWWVEGDSPVADQPSLQAVYPNLDPAHFIGGAWAGIPGLTAQDILKTVVVSMGTIGVFYSIVFEAVEQYGIRQVVAPTTWRDILAAAYTSENELRASDPDANRRVLEILMDGNQNGTGIPTDQNVYVDLAINPFTINPIMNIPGHGFTGNPINGGVTHECWITNRNVTPIPIDSNNNGAVSPGDYLGAISYALSRNAQDNVAITDETSVANLLGRIFDFFYYGTGMGDWINDGQQAMKLFNFIAGFPDVITAALATINVQAVANLQNNRPPDRGFLFLGDFLTGFFHALEGTGYPQPQIGWIGGPTNWAGNFTGATNDQNQILVYDQVTEGGIWWLGTFENGNINWIMVGSDATSPFGSLESQDGSIWVGSFNGNQSAVIVTLPAGASFAGILANGAIQWTGLVTTPALPQFLDNDDEPFWVGNFTGTMVGGFPAQQIMLYDSTDTNWWLATIYDGGITWTVVSSDAAAPFGPVLANDGVVWSGNYIGNQTALVVYNPVNNTWWVGVFSDGTISWNSLLTTPGQPQAPNGNGVTSWISNFTSAGSAGGTLTEQILLYDPLDGNWWLAVIFSGLIRWFIVSSDATAPFGNFANNNCFGWAGDFSGTSSPSQVLICRPAADSQSAPSWWLGTFNTITNLIQWISLGSDSNAPFGSSLAIDWRAYVSHFNSGIISHRDQLLIHNSSDFSWWMGTVTAGKIFWKAVSVDLGASNANSDKTDVSYKVGAIGWPNGGLPGRALEIALDPTKAFSFLQTALFDDLFGVNMMMSQTNPHPLIGYISIRIVPQTETTMGMQQFSPYSVMIEIVGYRSPESDALMDAIQSRVLLLNANQGLNAMLHWGLENDQLKAADLINTPLNSLLSGSALTRIQAFKAVRQFFILGHLPCFDNNFTIRLEL